MTFKKKFSKTLKMSLKNNIKHKENDYGSIAQKNGNIFEELIVKWCNNEENKSIKKVRI